MKILILQLARLGDIYMTWPTVRGLKRLYPDAEIHILSRPRFAAAWDGLEEIHQRHLLPTHQILGPLIRPEMDVKAGFDEMSQYVDGLKNEKFDWIINLTFSPFSSYLTHAISQPEAKVTGYTRFSDGFLSIPDDMSAYFYAQVGLGKPNRFHLIEIFATLAGLDLIEEDWAPPPLDKRVKTDAQVAVHIGASEAHKQISPAKWTTILNQFFKISNAKVALIGAPAEVNLAETILAAVPNDRVENYVGKTTLSGTFDLLSQVDLLVGPDSAPLHMASLLKTQTINLSVGGVSFWETGPRAPGSHVLRVADETELSSEKIAQAINKRLKGERLELGWIQEQKGAPSYWALNSKEADFQWKLIQAIYQETDFPVSEDPLFKDAVYKLSDINQLMIEQITALQNGGNVEKLGPIIERGEEIIEAIGQLVPAISPLVRWYQTEKIRLGPGERETLIEKSLRIHDLLNQVVQLYQASWVAKENESSKQEAP